MKWPFPRPSPDVLAELRKIAAIQEKPNPFALLFPSRRTGEFDAGITAAIYTAHFVVVGGRAKRLTARKRIARHARELATALRGMKAEEKAILLRFLPLRRQAMFDDFVETTHELADKARTVCRLAARPSGKLSSLARHDFVNELLDAAADADGNLTLNKRSERGSLIEALDLLSPYLPAEFTKGLSFSTLFRLRHTWGQNRRKKLKTLAV